MYRMTLHLRETVGAWILSAYWYLDHEDGRSELIMTTEAMINPLEHQGPTEAFAEALEVLARWSHTAVYRPQQD